MNVLDNYKVELLNLGEPVDIDDDTYFCKMNYNNMPFMIKTNKVCAFKKRKKNKNYFNGLNKIAFLIFISYIVINFFINILIKILYIIYKT